MRHPLRAAVLALALLSCRTAPPPAAKPAPPTAAPAPAPQRPPPPLVEAPPLLQLPAGVRPLRYALDLEVIPGRDEGFRGTSAIEIELDAARPYVWLHGRGLRVSSAEVEVPGAGTLQAAFTQVNDDGVAKVTFARPVGPGRATLRFAWEASWDGRLVGLYRSHEGGETYATTQLEAIYARRVFPSFDEPRFKTPFDVTLTVPADAVAVSNAPAASEGPAAAGLRKVRFATTEPLPTYLLFVGVGPFEVVTPPPLPPNEVRDRPLPVRLLAPKGHGGELRFAAEATAAIVPFFERYFAIPFPFAKLDQIAVPEFAAGAMENAGAIAYRNPLLLESVGTSEDDRRAIAAVQAHEIAHEWFGDLVTLPWWTDAWLNESFATWAGEKAEEAWRPEWKPLAHAFRRVDEVMHVDAAGSARAIRQPLRAMSDVFNQFDGMSYSKGAAVLRTFERFLGEERFRTGIRAYLAAHRNGTGSADALFAELSRAAGLPLQEAFAGFTDRPGIPLVSARVSCERGRARLLLAQARFVPRGSDARGGETWRVPVCARWEAGGAPKEGCTFLDGQREGALDLGAACPAWVMPHADAASYMRWTLAPPDLARLRRAGLPRLATIEKISVARNLRAAQQAGAVPWTDAMEAITALAADPDPDAAVEPALVLAEVHDRLASKRSQPAVEALARRLYAPVLAKLGWDPRPRESLGTRRLREEAADLLALVANDRAARAEAARRGRALAGLGVPARPAPVDPGLAEVALAAAVREGGAPAFDALVAKLATLDDASLRAKIVAALGRQTDPALAARAAALWRRPEVRPHEYRYLYGALSRLSVGRAAMLAEVDKDFDAFARSLPGGSLAYVPNAYAEGCDAAFAERVRAALEPHVGAHPEMRRPLAQALERIRICAAERSADGATAAAFFDRAARGGAPARGARAAR